MRYSGREGGHRLESGRPRDRGPLSGAQSQQQRNQRHVGILKLEMPVPKHMACFKAGGVKLERGEGVLSARAAQQTRVLTQAQRLQATSLTLATGHEGQTEGEQQSEGEQECSHG